MINGSSPLHIPKLQVEVTNRIILHGLRTRIAALGGSWVDEFDNVLWLYRVTLRAIEETLSLLYMVLKLLSPLK